MRLLVLLVLLGAPAFSPLAAAGPAAATPEPTDIMRRIRATEPRIRQAFALGSARSASFRDVVRRVEARDVIVYIELDSQLRGRLAGRMRWVAATSQARYVRVSLNPELTGYQFVAMLAHELEHVAEVGDARSVVDEPSLTRLYREVGSERRARSGAWDTQAAQLTGDTVRRELANSDVVTNAPVDVGRIAAKR